MESYTLIHEKENPLYKRKEVEFRVTSVKAPSKLDVIKFTAEKFKSHENSVAVSHIHGRFGCEEFIITANVYKTKEDKESTEIKTQKQAAAEKKAADEAKKAEVAA